MRRYAVWLAPGGMTSAVRPVPAGPVLRSGTAGFPPPCRLVPEVREAMDQARMELNMNYSDMINAGVVMFLRSQNLRVEVDLEGLLPVREQAP